MHRNIAFCITKPESDTIETDTLRPDTTGLEPPMVLVRSGQRGVKLYNDYLHLSIRSDDSCQTYRSAISLFFRFCDDSDIAELVDIEPIHVRSYLDHRTKELGASPVHERTIRPSKGCSNPQGLLKTRVFYLRESCVFYGFIKNETHNNRLMCP